MNTAVLKSLRLVQALAHGITIFLCWLVWWMPSHGQSLPGWQGKQLLAKPPEFGIRDPGDVLDHQSGAFQRISEELQNLDATHRYRVLLLVEPVLIATPATTLAAELHPTWLPAADGLVVVFEADTRSLGIGRNFEVSPELKGPGSLIPTHETATLINRALEAVDPKLAPEAYIEALMFRLAAEAGDYFKRRDTPPPASRVLRIALLGIGAVTLLALAGLGLGWVIRRATVADKRRCRFHGVDRPERLGAPCGASVTSSRFAAPASRQPPALSVPTICLRQPQPQPPPRHGRRVGGPADDAAAPPKTNGRSDRRTGPRSRRWRSFPECNSRH